MTLLVRLFCGGLAVLLCASLNGCMPSRSSQMEEEKESHYLAGKSCLNGMDYKGAIEEFRKALKMNPDSAAAHFQLGCLYEEKDPNPAAAIFHYEEFLNLRPNSDNSEWIRQRIINCKQDLAKTVLLPITPGVQHQLEQLADENKRLNEELDRWKAYYASRAQMPTNLSTSVQPGLVQTALTRAMPPSNSTATQSLALDTRQATAARTHTVQSGEAPYSIAKKYGVKLEVLMAANPGVDPRRLRIGQTLNIPSP